MDIEPGDIILLDTTLCPIERGYVTKTMLDRSYDRGVMVRRYEGNGQPYDMWVSESRIIRVLEKGE